MGSNNLRRWLLALAAVVLAAGPFAAAPRPVEAQPAAGAASGHGMPSFASDDELRHFLKSGENGEGGPALPPPPPPPPPPPAAMDGPSTPAAPSVSVASAADNPSITSTQVQGVDEGGIVKVSGDYLVILRRGRLFTVSTAGGALTPVDSINAYPPGVAPNYDWYDEMLIKGDLIAVVGFSYARGGTEVNRFRIGADGKLTFKDGWHLRSNDYYSSRNYASRLVGNTLVVYSPLRFRYGGDVIDSFPAMSKWTGEAQVWTRTATARQVYIPASLKKPGGARSLEAIHTVTRCDLTAPELDCNSTAVLGPSGRTFFVSRNAVYVWVTQEWSYDDADKRPAWLYRIPFDTSRPTAVMVHGGPLDQFSFNANEALGRLEVLVTSHSGGDAMWAPEFAHGRPALLTLPTARFGDGSRAAPQSDYHWLPIEGDNPWLGQNRFIGAHLLYSYPGEEGFRLVVAPTGAGAPVTLTTPFQVQRIEQVGSDGLAVGGVNEQVLQTVELSGPVPRLTDRFVQPNSMQAESRSQAFFFRSDSPDGRNGLMGLPVLRLSDNQWLADMLFVRRADARLADFGVLAAGRPASLDDGCMASCVDWYGNARPIFLRGRVFALLGYELVEGDASGAKIREVRRVSFAPTKAR